MRCHICQSRVQCVLRGGYDESGSVLGDGGNKLIDLGVTVEGEDKNTDGDRNKVELSDLIKKVCSGTTGCLVSSWLIVHFNFISVLFIC